EIPPERYNEVSNRIIDRFVFSDSFRLNNEETDENKKRILASSRDNSSDEDRKVTEILSPEETSSESVNEERSNQSEENDDRISESDDRKDDLSINTDDFIPSSPSGNSEESEQQLDFWERDTEEFNLEQIFDENMAATAADVIAALNNIVGVN